MQERKEYNFEGFIISGFLALFIGITLTVLFVLFTVKADSNGIFFAIGIPVLLLLLNDKKIKLEPKATSKLLGGSKYKKSKETTFFETTMGSIVLYVMFLLLAIFEFKLDVISIIGVFGIALMQPLLLKGLIKLEPNEAAVLIFFGKYKGTIRENGFFWVNPFYKIKKLPLRLRNMTVHPIKVNDKSGNPIMIGAVLAWRIKDTYKISFEVDNKANEIMSSAMSFVDTQSDAALRKIANMYTYDNKGEEKTLRSVDDEVSRVLENELNSRLMLAGLEILEARINYLAYAPEIAKTMLRRQQADAVVAAREKIVEGAVGIVEKTLDRLQQESSFVFSDYQKVVMTNNLLAILCADDRVH